MGTLGMPETNITFLKLAETAVVRSARNTVCIICKDSKAKGTYTYMYNQRNLITDEFDEENLNLIKEGFNKYGVHKIVIYAINGEDTLENALKALNKIEMNYLTCNYALMDPDYELLIKFIADRILLNMEVVIIGQKEADNKNFINFVSTGVKLNGKDVEPYRMNCKLAFILSTISQQMSATYYVLDDVTAVDEIEDENAAVNEGKLFITFDGEKYKLSRAVNSLTTLGTEDKECMKKIKVVEGSILIKGDIYKMFRDVYCGKNNNGYRKRIKFCGDINRYLKEMVTEGILNEDADNYVELNVGAMRKYMEEQGHNTANIKDIDILIDKDGYCGSKLFLKGNVRFVDAMEDMDLPLYY